MTSDKNQKQTDEERERIANPDNYCSHCNGFYYDEDSDDEDWMNCWSCKKWFHDSCAGNFVKNVNPTCNDCKTKK